jgi:beta-lactamase class A
MDHILQTLQHEIEELLRPLGGRVACLAVSEEQTGARSLVAVRADEIFPAASLAKVPILVELARRLAQPSSAYTWETRLEVPAEARVASDGVLAELSPQLRPTIQDIAHLMITISDNTASNLLLDLLGMEAINATMRELGLRHTRLERRFIDFAARRAGRDNWTTAADMVLLFEHIYHGRVPERERLINILLRQNDYRILPGYWGEDEPFAHKTGGLAGIMHDAGLLFHARDDWREPLILAVLSSEQLDLPLTQLQLARAGRAIRQAWLAG